MSYLLKYYPVAFSSAHGDLVYVVHDTVKANAPITYPNFKYVADVYVNGTMVSRLKIVPDPVNQFGVFNIGNIVRNYVDSQLTNPDFASMDADDLLNYCVSVEIKFGNEYGITPVLTTNILLTGEQSYYNYYTGRLFNTFENLSPYYGNFVTSRPYRTSVMLNATKHLLCIFPNDANGVLYASTHTASGSIIQSDSVGISITNPNKLKVLNVSPLILTDLFGFNFTNAAYYRIQFIPDDPPGEYISREYRFDLICEPRYTVYTLHFLNRFGGYESYSFSKVSKRGIDITKKDFTKLKYTISNAGVMQYSNGVIVNDDKVTYYGNFKERLELNSDWLTQDQLTWLSELVKSPQVYIEENGYLVPFTITEQSFEFKQRASDRHFNLKIAGEYGDVKNVQYR